MLSHFFRENRFFCFRSDEPKIEKNTEIAIHNSIIQQWLQHYFLFLLFFMLFLLIHC
jgi:hypothetical protein